MEQDASVKKYVLLSACTASFLIPFMGSSINLAIPSIGAGFNSSALLLSWVATSYLLASAAFLVPFGRLADIVGRKKIFTIGMLSFFVSSILCGMSWSIESLLIFRVLQGIGSAMLFGTGMAMVTSAFPPQERGKVLGINVAAVYSGLSLGPVLGGAMNHNLGWQSIFYFTAILSLVVLYFVIVKLKGEWAGARDEKFDLLGSVLYATGLVAFLYGISSIAIFTLARYVLLAGLVVLAIFIKYEMHEKYPVLNLSLFAKNVTFAFSNLAALIHYSATFAVGFLISIYLQVVMGYNSQVAGFVLLSQPVLMALLSPFTGSLSDRVAPRIVASLGMALTTLGLFVFCFLSVNTPLWLVAANLAMLGTGFALFSSPNTNSVMGSVEKRFYGVASSTLGTMRLTGQAMSMAVVTLLLALYVGNVKLGDADPVLLTSGAKTAFIVFTVLCLGGILASLARGNVSADPQKSLNS